MRLWKAGLAALRLLTGWPCNLGLFSPVLNPFVTSTIALH